MGGEARCVVSSSGTAASAAKHGTLVVVTDALDGLDALDWQALQAAYGPAGGVPALVRQLLAVDAAVRAAAVEELYGTVWHQGTVYESTPHVVPFLVAVVADEDAADETRAQVALLLVCIASATSFVLPQQPREMLQPGWLRDPGGATPSRDLTEECLAAVMTCAADLARALREAPPATRAALVATLAATTPDAGSATLMALRPFEDDPDPRLAAAARAARLMADDALTNEDLLELASVDAEAADYLNSIVDWPVRVRAVELVRELAERVVAERLG